MKLRYIVAALLFITVVACNNEASVQNETDSVSKVDDTSNQSGWPEPGDIMGGDTVPSAETQADTSATRSKR